MKAARMQCKVVIFDFDGVFIEDSEAVFKRLAWRDALLPYVSDYERLLEKAHQSFGHGKSGGRAEIVSAVLNESKVPPELHKATKQAILEAFALSVENAIVDTGLVDGAVEMLAQCNAHNVPVYLNSGTATQALKRTVKMLEIDRYIVESLGSTPEPIGGDKVSNLRYIAEKESVTADDMVLIGDGLTDWRAAETFGCRFVGFSNRHNRWFEEQSELTFDVVRTFADLRTKI